MNVIQQALNTPTPEPQMVNIDIAGNPLVNRDILKQKIIHNIEMSDEELTALLSQSYNDILSCIFDMGDLQYLGFVATPRFINTLTHVISKQNILHPTRVYINKLVYDFITYSHEDNDENNYTTQLMLRLASQINEDVIRQLIGAGLSTELACFVALARYSNNNEAVNIRRVNFIICTNISKEYMLDGDSERQKAELQVIEIYKKLFNKMTILFEATMFDVYDTSESWVTDNISEMYSITTLAVLDILNSMSMADIRAILMSYTADYVNRYSAGGTRISFRSLSSDYDRILSIVEHLKSENIYVP